MYLSLIVDAVVHYDHMNGYSELVIDRVNKDDSGTYTCTAENSVGTIKSVGFVYVKGKDTLPSYVTSFYIFNWIPIKTSFCNFKAKVSYFISSLCVSRASYY